MATLPEILGSDIEIVIGSHTFSATPLSLLRLADISGAVEKARTEHGNHYADVYGAVLMLEASLKNNYPDVTVDYVSRLITAETMDDVTTALNKLGIVDPKASTGESSSEPSQPVPDGTPAPSEN